RQLSQERQCQACQPTPTRWPACHRPGTSLPTASITPTTSCPGTRGKVMPGHWPSLVIASLWQMPQAWTLIRTDPGRGSGIGRSTSSRGPPGRETWATRIVGTRREDVVGTLLAMGMFISVSCGVTVGVAVSPGLLFVRLGNGHLPGVRPRRRVTRARREPKSAGFHGPPFGSSKCSRTVTSHNPYSLPFSRTVASLVSLGCRITARRRVLVLPLGFRATRCTDPDGSLNVSPAL